MSGTIVSSASAKLVAKSSSRNRVRLCWCGWKTQNSRFGLISLAQRFEGRADLGRMVAVIVDDDRAVELADLASSADRRR